MASLAFYAPDESRDLRNADKLLEFDSEVLPSMAAKCQILCPHLPVSPFYFSIWRHETQIPPPALDTPAAREERTGLLIGFLLIKEMWQIRFFGGV